ncbi:hypothetical protein JCM16303_003709 [Sporobolomyces ruberrimus]
MEVVARVGTVETATGFTTTISLPVETGELPPPSTSSIYSPPLRVSSLPISSLPLPLPPTGPASYRSSHSHPRTTFTNSPLPTTTPAAAGPPLRISLNSSLPSRPSSSSSASTSLNNNKRTSQVGTGGRGGGIRSRSSSIVSERNVGGATPTSSSSRLPTTTNRSKEEDSGVLTKSSAEERKKEELKRLERAERFGISTSTTTTTTTTSPVFGTSRSRLEGIVGGNTFSRTSGGGGTEPTSSSSRSTTPAPPLLSTTTTTTSRTTHPLPLPVSSSFSSSKKGFGSISSSSTNGTTTSTGFQIPYKNRTSRSRKRSRFDPDSDDDDNNNNNNEGSTMVEEGEEREERRNRSRFGGGSSSRNGSPEREREVSGTTATTTTRERGVSRWDRAAVGSDRFERSGSVSSTSTVTPGGVKKFGTGLSMGNNGEGSKPNYASSLLRFPIDNEVSSPASSSNRFAPNHRHHHHHSSNHSNSSRPNNHFVPIGNFPSVNGNGNGGTSSSKSSSRKSSNPGTPRARSPDGYREKGWDHKREMSGQRESRTTERRKSRSYSPGEIPETVVSPRGPRYASTTTTAAPSPVSRFASRRSRSRTSSRNRSRSPEPRSFTPPIESRRRIRSPSDSGYSSRRMKLEDKEDETNRDPVPTSTTPPLPLNRFSRNPSPIQQRQEEKPVEPSDTPPRPSSMPLPRPNAATSSNSTPLLPSRRRLPPSAIVEPIPSLGSTNSPQTIRKDQQHDELSMPRSEPEKEVQEEDEELEEGEEKEEGEITLTTRSTSSSRSRIPPKSPPPPVTVTASTTPPRPSPATNIREASIDTRGETPPLPSPVVRPEPIATLESKIEIPPVPSDVRGPTSATEPAMEDKVGMDPRMDREREEGEIPHQVDAIKLDTVETEKVREGDVQDKEAEVIAENAAEKAAEVESERIETIGEVGKEESRAEKESEVEEDVDMFEVRDLEVSKEVEVDQAEPEKEQENVMEVDEPVSNPPAQVANEVVEVEAEDHGRKEEPIQEPRMDVDEPESLTVQLTAPPIPSPPTAPSVVAPELAPLAPLQESPEPIIPTPEVVAPVSLEERQPSPAMPAQTVEEPAHPSSTTPLDHHSPPQPISPPTKHIPSCADDRQLSSPPLEESKVISTDAPEEHASQSQPTAPLVDREQWFKATWEDFAAHQGLMIPFLMEEFEDRDQGRGEKMVELRKEYRIYDQDWQAHVKRLDKIKERFQRKSVKNSANSTAAQTPSIDSSGMPYYPEPVTPGPLALGGGRANRRGGGLTNSSWGYGDAVRSEAEFLEILASLENADLRDPDVRAARTAAVVPDMAVDPSERAEIISCTFDDERYRIDDPVSAYGVTTPMETWTEAEVEMFCKGYSQHPKQFGKIAQGLADKTTAQCVLFYYRMKNAIDFRSLADRRGRDGRRKKTKKRPGEGKGKGSSLLSNLKGAKSTMLGNRDRDEDEDDDEEDRPVPPSPRNARPPLPSNDSAPLIPRTATTSATPLPARGALDRLFEDDNDEYTPSAASKASRNPRNLGSQLHSEGMMEAAEVLGALGVAPNDEQDDGGPASLRPRAAKTNRKVRMDLDDDGAIETVSNEKLKPKRKTNSSSYWSAAEKSDIVRLLEVHGKNWKAIGEEMTTKTAVQCRNWFTNNAKKLGLRNLVSGTGMNDFDDNEDDSPAMTPSMQSPAIARAPTATSSHLSYFPTPDANQLPPLPSIPGAASATSKAGMHLRNMLNEDTPDEEASHSAKEDWFGGGGGGQEDDPSEDESFPNSAKGSRPMTANERAAPPQHNRIVLSNGLARASSHLPTSAQLPSFPTSLPNHRFDRFLPHQSASMPLPSHWSPSPASPFGSYGSPATPGATSAPTADHYRRPTPPDYFQAKSIYSHPQLQHAHQHRFSAPPGPLQPSPPIPSSSTFAARPSSALPPSSSLYQNSWTPAHQR